MFQSIYYFNSCLILFLMNTNLLNQLSFDLVKDKVMEDKMKECIKII